MHVDHHVLGPRVRERRLELGLSVRALAARAGVSPAYVSAIESERNPSTGRAPVVSLAVAGRLADALELEVEALVGAGGAHGHAGAHVLALVAAPPPAGVLAAIDRALGEAVDHWLHIADPRDDLPAPDARGTSVRFALGAPPYATPRLDPEALLAAVEREVEALAERWRGRRVGLLIADCSAVMRWLGDAASEVALESRWHGAVEAIWARHLGAPVAADVCAYRADDLAALGLTIDQLATALDLVRHHDRVLLLDGARTVEGPPAVRRLLDGARPPGTTAAAWQRLTAAAAPGLVGARA